MKKIIFIVLFLFSGFLFAKNFSFDCGVVDFAFECNEKGPGGTCDLTVLDFNFFSENNGLGLSVSPFSIFTYINDMEYNPKIEFLNLSFYYDFFRYQENFELKPFVSAGFLNPMNLFDFTAKCGLSFSFFADDNQFEHMRLRIFSTETGVKYCDNNFSFYCNVGFDAGILIYGTLKSIYDKTSDKYYE